MNRENKLAIIIGFSLVLVVAVLISDHFSRARTVQIGSDMKPATASDVGAASPGLTRTLGNDETIPVSQSPLVGDRVPRISNVSTTGGETGPDVIEMGGSGQGDGRGPSTPEVSETSDDPTGGIETPGVPPKPFSAGALRYHDVQSGDKLYRIADKYYNDGTLWKTLAAYNKSKIPNVDNLRVGVRIEIPPKDVLLGEAVLPPAGATPPKESAKKETTGGRPGSKPEAPAKTVPAKNDKAKDSKDSKDTKGTKGFDTYRIARGEDLSTIARKLLGDARRANELYRLNKDVLEDAHTVKAGTVIKIPAR